MPRERLQITHGRPLKEPAKGRERGRENECGDTI